MKKPWIYGLLLLPLASSALAQDTKDSGSWYLQTSVYTKHYSSDPNHNNQHLIGLEHEKVSGWIFGVATFLNSFDQRSYYTYAGKRFENAAYRIYFKPTGGLLEGYKGEYKDKIPLNRFGFAPVIIPSLGAHYGPVAAELVLLGFNAAMVTTGARF